MFNLKSMFQTVGGALSGDKDVLEAILFGGIWVAGADGRISKDELTTVENNACADPFVTRIYTADVIHFQMNKAVDKLKVGGPAAAEKELRDLARRDIDTRQAVYLSIFRVAALDGVDENERRVLNQIANALNLTNEDRDDIEGQANPKSGGFVFE